MTPAASALFALVALLKSGLTLRQALLAWPEELSGHHQDEAREVARRLELGDSVRSAVQASSLAWLLLPAVSVHLSTGVDLVAWLERVAEDREQMATATEAARGAAAGAALSARMVAGLPLLFVPLTPMTRASLTDPLGLAMAAMGVALAVTGLRWIGRLLPRPPQADDVAGLATSLAAMLEAGLALSSALEALAAEPGASPALWRARRMVALGATWSQALQKAGGDCLPLAAAIGRSQRFGVPLAEGLESLAAARRGELTRAFEGKMKRAPVLMVVPLTCCILPSYALLALGPFLRSMALG
jgi:tight adherence protein B